MFKTGALLNIFFFVETFKHFPGFFNQEKGQKPNRINFNYFFLYVLQQCKSLQSL